MKRRTVLWALAALNAALLVALMWKLGAENVAHAQRGGRGDYLMIPAKVSGASNGVIYMVDTRNGLLGAFVYDNNKHDLLTMDPINLNRVFEAGPGVGGGGKQPPRRP